MFLTRLCVLLMLHVTLDWIHRGFTFCCSCFCCWSFIVTSLYLLINAPPHVAFISIINLLRISWKAISADSFNHLIIQRFSLSSIFTWFHRDWWLFPHTWSGIPNFIVWSLIMSFQYFSRFTFGGDLCPLYILCYNYKDGLHTVLGHHLLCLRLNSAENSP